MPRDKPLLSPVRLYQACMTYLWWVDLYLKGMAEHCGSFAAHLTYFRREHARHAEGAGYNDSWRMILARLFISARTPRSENREHAQKKKKKRN